ncbi:MULTISPECIES: SurA N-terminal domain-containing protein [unclassified Duganella]|uniref:SurA N-terminal domain-containing protein n=1 Tax=unclassified Duganella TaxID=2636909 RepID=UPI00088676DC|nr:MULTISPECIES: SurA N-terminal domain-containing protein [unclassified Duganella]SDG80321.1 peptidyl-prolyl cis-trans isomerase D [Duganella sp. OV458]SDK07503.1 peptidyl-prolyl cis-trans isomerase D [Duganella sp. OV510]
MFEFIRTHQRLMQILLAIVIVPSFALVGVGSYQSFGDDANTIAKIDGKPLTQQEFDNAVRNQLDTYRQRLGAQFDQKMFDTPEFKQNVLDQLIAQRAIAAEVLHSHLSVTEPQLQKVIMDQFGGPGAFDMERYKAILAQQGMRPEDYDARLRRDLEQQQLATAVESTGFAPRSVSKNLSDIVAQEREVQELLLPVADFVPQVKVTDEMVKAFYEKNSKFFEVPEQAKIEYVVLNNDVVAGQVNVSDAEVSDYYAKNSAQFTTPETRRASHILIAVKKGASAADTTAAKAKADAIVAELRKNPADFAKLAKAKSEDPGSAEQGGDLGVIEKGSLVAPVETAIAKLKQGEISDAVQSEFGWHVLTVTELKPAVVKPLEVVKADVADLLKKQKASKKYSEMAETFSNTVYEQADSLKPAAEKLGLKVEAAAGVSRNPSPMAGAALYNNPKFLTALFSNDSISSKRNTEAVEIAPNTLISGRIVEFKPAAKRPLAEVDAQIRQRVTIEEAAKLAAKAGEEKLAALKKSGDASGFGGAKLVSRGKPEGINGLALQSVMKADASKLPAYVGVDVPGTGYGVYRISKVQQPASVDEAQRKQEAEQISNLVAQQEMAQYVELLKAKAKVKILKPVASTTTVTEVK